MARRLNDVCSCKVSKMKPGGTDKLKLNRRNLRSCKHSDVWGRVNETVKLIEFVEKRRTGVLEDSPVNNITFA